MMDDKPVLKQDHEGAWYVDGDVAYVLGNVNGPVDGNVVGDVLGSVFGSIGGDVDKDIGGTVWGDVGTVWGKIERKRHWGPSNVEEK
jgi:hypothetical protein